MAKYVRHGESDQDILPSLKLLRNETLELYIPKNVPVINYIPEPFELYRKWVAPNIPVVIQGGAKNWAAVKNWNKEYLIQKLKDKKVTVAVTPNGYADAIQETLINGKLEEVFVLPEEKLMTLSELYKELEVGSTDKSSKGVFYLQKQNSNLTEEFPELLPDIDKELTWATETFQSKPTAINLWIGDQRAISSLHKDPFENIYCVISGQKEFILFPPTDRPWLPYKSLPIAKYIETEPGKFETILLDKSPHTLSSDSIIDEYNSSKVPWIDIDPIQPNLDKYPLYNYATPITVQVNQGDILYLPSLWFHYVKQSHMCIAVNYWFDMNLDIKYAYFQMLDSLAKNLPKMPV